MAQFSEQPDLKGTDEHSTKRVRILTQKGEKQYDETRDEYTDSLAQLWSSIIERTDRISMHERNTDLLKTLLADIKYRYERYKEHCDKYSEFLQKTHTEESLKEKKIHLDISQSRDGTVQSKLQLLQTLIQISLESQSNRSTRSSSRSKTCASNVSSLSSQITQKQAKADGAIVRVEFAKKELELRKQQAHLKAKAEREREELEAELLLLKEQKEAAAATAEVSALREAESQNNLGSPGEENPTERTANFVQTTSFNSPQAIHSPQSVRSSIVQPLDSQQEQNHSNLRLNQHAPESANLNPNAPQFIYNPSTHPNAGVPPPIIPSTPGQDMTSELTKFLLKKDLLLTRLSSFNDRPENYRSWKTSFSAVMLELGVTPREEIDLLIKWSGPDSQRQIRNIASANTSNPEKGLQRIWQCLQERYGSPEMLEESLRQRIANYPKIGNKEYQKLYDLADIISEIEAVKEDDACKALLAYYDSSSGVSPIVAKLPYSLQEKWTTSATHYNRTHAVTYPPFGHFAEFLREQSRIRNNPSFKYETTTTASSQPKKDYQSNNNPRTRISSRKTETGDPDKKSCPLHNAPHSLNECRSFRNKPIETRRSFLRDKNICFRCCNSSSHSYRNCDSSVHCSVCNSTKHASALHIVNHGEEQRSKDETKEQRSKDETKEQNQSKSNKTEVKSQCTQICGNSFAGKSCAKTLLVQFYPQGHPEYAIKLYAMVDDQSNRSLGRPELFDLLESKGISPGTKRNYDLLTCAGKVTTSGRVINNFVIESMDRSTIFDVPSLIECEQVPNIREEIPTPEVAQHYPHLYDITHHIAPIDATAEILLLIGRDIISAHHVLDQRIGPANAPYAQKLPLGWTIIGETCLGKAHTPTVNVQKTHLLKNGRVSLFPPCGNNFKLRETSVDSAPTTHALRRDETFGSTVFERNSDDEKQSLSIDEKLFLKILDESFKKDADGNWEAPLPFREPRVKLSNNRQQALKRAKTLDTSLRRDPKKENHFMDFMKRIFENQHAEIAPPLKDNEECWYLPIFGVYHPTKPNQIRAVFDSSAKHDGISLNDVLLTGPDLTNSLLGVLLRFRRERVAIVGDIQQMFYCFRVREDHRNYLRFFWYKENDLSNELIEYRMRVHVFGNSPSPAVATFGLRKCVDPIDTDPDVREYVNRDFYVDDGLTSVPTPQQAIDLMQKTQQALKKGGNLRLHKISSNSEEVMNAFPPDDLAKDIKGLDIGVDPLPNQRSLGICWSLETDSFLFQVSQDIKPFTRRGLLSTINSIFDPLGFLAPVVIEGKLLLRSLLQESRDWDDPLPIDYLHSWESWIKSLTALQEVNIPRAYLSVSFIGGQDKHIHVFSDASEKAIAAVSYVQASTSDEEAELGFILGKAKVAPVHGHTIPRLELCAALLATELAESISSQLDIPIDKFSFHTDSKVVLGYIYNQERRFYNYVANRVDKIRNITKPDQWTYVSTTDNPADQATRSIKAEELSDSMWLLGPSFLMSNSSGNSQSYELQHPENDKEVRPETICRKTTALPATNLGIHRFTRYSCWKTLVEVIARLQHIAQSFAKKTTCNSWHTCSEHKTVDAYKHAEQFIIKQVQQAHFKEDIKHLKDGNPLSRNSRLLSLSPILDDEGVLRVGGRLNRSQLSQNEKNPVLIPGDDHTATLLIRHYHESIHHQGRHLTEGVIRSSGLWITGAKRLISSILHKCVKCRKLRGTANHQKMADLPEDRLTPSPPFTFVGVDIFGPWNITVRRTRGGSSSGKRWAALFTCLTTRAVHIEVIEDMSSSSFINAVRRFYAIRGKVQEFRSDRGSNFIGATDDLQINANKIEDSAEIKDFLYNTGAKWTFNPPHASHFGGTWERMIGSARRILDSMFLENVNKKLTHEVLVTLMAEVSAIINNRPLVPVSSDVEDPFILTPSILLTQKTGQPTSTYDHLDVKDIYKASWKHIQVLSETFWKRWNRDYLQNLQARRKWRQSCDNVKPGDVVLLKDKNVPRNEWPLGIILRVFPSEDGLVRKVELRVTKSGKPATYIRPITETIPLVFN